MKKTLILAMVILFVFGIFAYAQKGMCGEKKNMQCCKSCVMCNLDTSVTVSNTADGVLVEIKGKNKEDIKKIQESIKECCCFNKSSRKNSK